MAAEEACVMQTFYLSPPATWPFKSPTIPAKLMPSKNSYTRNAQGLVFVAEADLLTLLGLGFCLYGSTPNLNDFVSKLNNSGDATKYLNGVGTLSTPAGGSSVTVEQITTGASPVSADLSMLVTAITSGGTGGDEFITLAKYPLIIDSYSNPEKLGTLHTLYLAAQTDPGDVVKIQVEGGSLASYDDAGNRIGQLQTNEVALEFAAAFVSFRWTGETWALVNYLKECNAEILSISAAGASLSDPENGRIVHGGAGSLGASFIGDPGANTYQYLDTGAAPVSADMSYRGIIIETGGTGGTEQVFVAGPGAVQLIGFRQLITLAEQTDPADVVDIQAANIKTEAGADITSITMDAVDEFLLIEAWDASTWRMIRSTATVTPT
jgi:hypothetical protein